MNGGSRCWASLPADALAYIINECGLCQSDVSSIRLVCVHWRSTTNSHLKSLAPACTSLEQVAGIAEQFPYLTNCDLTRCDTRLVGHASLCRDASARLSTLLAALSRMPSLTSLHISDTFSERMGQKHWASLVCAQALVDSSHPSVPPAPLDVPMAPLLLDPAAAASTAATPTFSGAESRAGGIGGPAISAATTTTDDADPLAHTLAGLGAALAVGESLEPRTPGPLSAASSPLLDAVTAAEAAIAAVDIASAASGSASCPPRSDFNWRSLSCAHPASQRHAGDEAAAINTTTAATTATTTTTTTTIMSIMDGDGDDDGIIGGSKAGVVSGVAHEGWAAATAAPDTPAATAIEALPPGEFVLPPGEFVLPPLTEQLASPDATQLEEAASVTEQPDSLVVQLEAEPVTAEGTLEVAATTPIAATTAGAEEQALSPPPALEVAAPLPPPPPPPPPLVLSASELADPGIKSFARAISRPGATHQHAFWLPDWCGRLAGLQELHIRGRQRPSTGLPPCLLWLHVGRTAPQLTSLSLVRLSLVTLPEQLQHLTALTRLVAQDCSLSLMPRGLAAGLPRLEVMDLSLNGLTSLPPDFTQLTALKHLDLQRNKLVALPADIGRISSVTCLLLNNNQLRQLPASLAALRNVEVLSCSYNWLGGMGPSLPLLCTLPRLRRLELACVSDVRCRLVPPQDLRLLAGNLTHLDLAANNLVPADVLGTLTSLRSLVLSDCGLLAVPPWVRRLAPSLHHLDLSNNSLSELPTWLSACTRLRYLSIAHNRLSIRVPPSVLEQMPQLEVVESE